MKDNEYEIDQESRYNTAEELGDEGQQRMLKALDFDDEVLGAGCIQLNVCTRMTRWNANGENCPCGLSFPNKLWAQTGAGSRLGNCGIELGKKWGFKCKVVWAYLVEEALDKGEDSDAYT